MPEPFRLRAEGQLAAEGLTPRQGGTRSTGVRTSVEPKWSWLLSGLIDQATNTEARFQRLESGLAAQRMQLAAQEAEIAANKARIAELEWSSHGFSMTRNRFISTAKRDKLGTAGTVDYDIIGTVNRDAHEGNAKFDATLYIDGTRMDDEVYTAIYGSVPRW